MNWRCKIFGHKWSEKDPDPFRQNCQRDNCLAERFLVFHKYGKTRCSWEVMEYKDLEEKKSESDK